MKTSILTSLLALTLILGGCEDQAVVDYEDYNKHVIFMLMFNQSRLQTTLSDQGNGTVLYEQRSTSNFSSQAIIYSRKYFNKCLAGQVYREDHNDCRGTGDRNDYYGAALYEYCDQNDLSCNESTVDGDLYIKDYLTGDGNSQVYDACAGQTINGKALQAADSLPWTHPDFENIFYDLPLYEDYWSTNRARIIEEAEYLRPGANQSQGIFSTDLKTAKKFVICSTNELK